MKGTGYRPLIAFIAAVLIINAAVFGIHAGARELLSLPMFAHRMTDAYLFNTVLGILITGTLFLFRYRFASSLGFIFFGSSLLKFGLFFAFFYPYYLEDGDVSRGEFGTFFVPYALNLILETYFLVRVMNRL
ncbi:MAG: hypothetical protein F6K11_07025 [Leptolyngbya sp. SIO3F4]|nr:hypothetical protein [Leptolyngbya sp. SIO3F4]